MDPTMLPPQTSHPPPRKRDERKVYLTDATKSLDEEHDNLEHIRIDPYISNDNEIFSVTIENILTASKLIWYLKVQERLLFPCFLEKWKT